MNVYPANESLCLLFDIGTAEGTLPMRALVLLARTCKWFYDRSQLRRKAALRTFRWLGRAFFRPTPAGSTYITRAVPAASLLVRGLSRSITIFSDLFPILRVEDACGRVVFMNMWLRASSRIACKVGLLTHRETVINVSCSDYIETGNGKYAVNLRLYRHIGFPLPDDTAVGGADIFAYTGGMPYLTSVWDNFTEVVLHYRVLA